MSSSKQVAQRVFGELSVGTHELDTHRVVHTGKYVIVMPKLDHWPTQNIPSAEVHVIAYPAPADLAQFELAAQGTDTHSVGRMYPGSIGMIKLRPTPKGLLIEYAQNAFHTSDKYRANLPRRLATKYGGWKTRALNAIKEVTSLKKLNLIE